MRNYELTDKFSDMVDAAENMSDSLSALKTMALAASLRYGKLEGASPVVKIILNSVWQTIKACILTLEEKEDSDARFTIEEITDKLTHKEEKDEVTKF